MLEAQSNLVKMTNGLDEIQIRQVAALVRDIREGCDDETVLMRANHVRRSLDLDVGDLDTELEPAARDGEESDPVDLSTLGWEELGKLVTDAGGDPMAVRSKQARIEFLTPK